MFSVRCLVAAIRAGLPMPATTPWAPGDLLETAFRDGSLTAKGPAVRLRTQVVVDPSLHVPAGVKSTAFSLHSRLQDLLTGVAPAAGTRDVGLLLADTYEADPADGSLRTLGLMFDRGFHVGGETVVETSYHSTPRQGCALFLRTIAAVRGTGPAFDAEVAFTTVHEMGHVFNLWHAAPGLAPTWMTRSVLGGPHATTTFLEAHREFLARCEAAPEVQPWGTRYGQRNGLAVDGDGPANSVRGGGALRMAIDVRPATFWPFEPVELEVKLSTATNAGDVRVPNEIDPGYDRFRIWIEEPGGERRRYRSTQHYCSVSDPLRVGPGRPFERDVTLHGQAGGLTFRQPGVHTIRAELLLGPKRRLLSNAVEVEVLAGRPRSTQYRRLLDVLRHPDVARRLYYRDGPLAPAQVEALDKCARALRSRASGAYIEYAVGRLLARRASRRVRRQAGAVAGALERLRRAGASRWAGPLLRRKVAGLLDGSIAP